MPIILPTPDELERLSWYERERTIARAALAHHFLQCHNEVDF